MKLEKWQFSIQPSGLGTYSVAYYTRGKDSFKFCAMVTDMELIDSVKRIDKPSQKALKALYNYIKNKQLNSI